MAPGSGGTQPDDSSYLRGVRVADVDTGRVIRVLIAVGLVALVVLALILTVSAARQNSRLSTLRSRGVPVTVTVAGCLGISSGIGMAVEYWECRGTYTLAGQSYKEVIGGSRAHLREGQTVDAIAVPGDPGLLSTAAAATRKHSDWAAYVTPIVLGGVTATLIVGLLAWSKWRHRRVAEEANPPSGAPG
jgi:hypothetical protein